MEANKMEPFEPTHPGEVIKDEIEYRGISKFCQSFEVNQEDCGDVLKPGNLKRIAEPNHLRYSFFLYLCRFKMR